VEKPVIEEDIEEGEDKNGSWRKEKEKSKD